MKKVKFDGYMESTLIDENGETIELVNSADFSEEVEFENDFALEPELEAFMDNCMSMLCTAILEGTRSDANMVFGEVKSNKSLNTMTMRRKYEVLLEDTPASEFCIRGELIIAANATIVE